MKPYVVAYLYLILTTGTNNVFGQSQNLTFKANVKTVSEENIPKVYFRFFIQDTPNAVDSLFADKNGVVNQEIGINTLGTSFHSYSSQSSIVKEITPNIIAGPVFQGKLVYKYPSQAELLFIDAHGRTLHNNMHLPSGIYHYYLQFDNNERSALKRIVLTQNCEVNIQLEKILFNSKDIALKSAISESAVFYAELIKDGYITQRDTILIDSNVIERAYQMTEAAEPTAGFSFTGNLEVGGAVLFNASESAPTGEEQLLFSWDFGNGKKGQAESIPHIYNAAGDYTVTLTATGPYGASNSVSKVVSISESAVPETYTGKVVGFVTNEIGENITGATIDLLEGDASETTNFLEKTELTGLPVGIPLHFKVSKTGYVHQIVELTIPSDTIEGVFYTTLQERDLTQTLSNAEFGGQLEAEDGSVIQLPIEALVNSEGEVVEGDVDISITPVDVAYESESFPGTFTALRSTGDSGVLLSYGVSEFHFEQDGEELELAPGKKATILIPIYTSGATVGDKIPLWSINEDNGIWVEEGVGVVVASAESPTGLAFQAQVGHFSWWNCDDFDMDRNKDGLCWRWECTTARCYKVKVGCWMSGARRDDGSPALRNKPKMNKEERARDEIPPVFEVREFIPETGRRLRFPNASDVYIEARSFINDSVFVGAYNMVSLYGPDTFSIELVFVETLDTFNLPLNYVKSDYLELLDMIIYNTPIPTKGTYCVFIDRGEHPSLNGIATLENDTGVVAVCSTSSPHHSYVHLEPGIVRFSVGATNQAYDGNFTVGIFKDDHDTIVYGDSIANKLAYRKDIDKYTFKGKKDDFICLKLKTDEELNTYNLQLLNSEGEMLKKTNLDSVIVKLYEDDFYTVNLYSLADAGSYSIELDSLNLSDTIDFTIDITYKDNLGFFDTLYCRAQIPEKKYYKFLMHTFDYPALDGEFVVYQNEAEIASGASYNDPLPILLDTGYVAIKISGAQTLQMIRNFYIGLFNTDTTAINIGDTIVEDLQYRKDTNFYAFSGVKDTRISIRKSLQYFTYPRNLTLHLWNSNGEELIKTTNAESVITLPEDGKYTLGLMSNSYYDTGTYKLITELLLPDTLINNTLTEKDVAPDQNYYFVTEVPEGGYSHLSLRCNEGSGTFDVFTGENKMLGGYNIYNPDYLFNHAFNLQPGKYFIKVKNTNATKVYINLPDVQPLTMDEKGKAAFTDTISLPKQIKVFEISVGEGDGLHGILRKSGTEKEPYGIELIYNNFSNASEPSYLNRFSSQLALDTICLNESSAWITSGYSFDTTIVLVIHSDSTGIFDFEFHHLKPSNNIIVDDDFADNPSAHTSSLIAAAYAISDGGTITIENGTYSSYVPIYVYSDSVKFLGQSKEGVKLRNLINRSNTGLLYFHSANSELANFTASCAEISTSINTAKNETYIHNINIEPLGGDNVRVGGLVFSGNNLTISNINLTDGNSGFSLSGVENSSITNCNITTRGNGIYSAESDRLTIKNNTITVDQTSRAIEIRSGYGSGGHIVDSNTIFNLSDNTMGDNGIVEIDEEGNRGDNNTTFIRGNTIVSASTNPAFYVKVRYPNSKIIVENNSYSCTNNLGGRAATLTISRTDGAASIIVRNNVFDSLASNKVILFYGPDIVSSGERFAIYNNNFRMAPGADADSSNSFIVVDSYFTNNDTVNAYIVNNIFEGNNQAKFIGCDDDLSIYADYNIVYNFRKYIGEFGNIIGTTNDFTTDPYYIDGDLHVSPSGPVSPAIGNGAPVGLYEYLPDTDKDGISRPQGAGNDIGAYEQ